MINFPGSKVSSHLPARGGSKCHPSDSTFSSVSSHLPARGGSPVGTASHARQMVSSHLPARGGSVREAIRQIIKDGFQSPPREGRIRWPVRLFRSVHGFQSPPREGRIGDDFLEMQVDMDVSSHLPARGGSSRSVMYWMASLFPVTSPRGEDPDAWITGTQPAGFQSPPREGRIPPENRRIFFMSSFQSPPREGRIGQRRRREVAS